MNFRNDKHYLTILEQGMHVENYGNFYIIGHPENSVTVTAVYPSMQDLARVFLVYSKLQDGLDVLNIPYRFQIERGQVCLYFLPSGWSIRVQFTTLSSALLTIKRVYVGMYGSLRYQLLYTSEVATTNLCTTLKTQLQ